VVGLGQNSIDLVARVPVFPLSNSKHHIDALAWIPGGQVASAMVGCARLGWRTCYIGRFGDDDLGVRGRASLEEAGVDLAVTVVPGARSRFAIILVDAPTGNRTVLWDRDRGLDCSADDVPVDAVAGGRVLLVDCEDIEASIGAA
jgi:sugar/nucleoside kinase (ribokinase family)